MIILPPQHFQNLIVNIMVFILKLLLTYFVQGFYRGYQAATDCQVVAGRVKRVYRVAVVNYCNNSLVVYELPIRYYEKINNN